MADQIEKRLTRAIEEMTPEIYDKLAGRPTDQTDEEGTVLSIKKRAWRTGLRKKIYIAVTAAAMICLTMGFGWNQFLSADSVIGLDVNPSLEFTTNKRGRVVSVQTYNEDARTVIDGMNLKYADINTAVNAVLGSMLRHKYLEKGSDTVLLTVQNSNNKRASELREMLLADIDEILAGNGTDGRVVSQIVEEDKELEQLSQSHHMSCGKMKLIQNILTQNDSYTMEELGRMSVQELMELAGKENMDLHEHMEYDKQDFCSQDHESGSSQGDEDPGWNKRQKRGRHGSDSEHHRQEME